MSIKGTLMITKCYYLYNQEAVTKGSIVGSRYFNGNLMLFPLQLKDAATKTKIKQ